MLTSANFSVKMGKVQCKGSLVLMIKKDVDDNAVIGADTAYSFSIHISKG